ncbi:hypothetical protein EI052_24735, partial [Escherichia coli]|nr:hypothetical protein [Escherichia coli]
RRPAGRPHSLPAFATGRRPAIPPGTGARQGGRIPTRHRRPARWADFHTARGPLGKRKISHAKTVCCTN